METLMNFMLYRMIYLGAIAVGIIILAFVVIVILKKLSLSDRVRDVAGPIARQQLKNRGGVAAIIEKQIPTKRGRGERS